MCILRVLSLMEMLAIPQMKSYKVPVARAGSCDPALRDADRFDINGKIRDGIGCKIFHQMDFRLSRSLQIVLTKTGSLRRVYP